jgi:hypothetical protein
LNGCSGVGCLYRVRQVAVTADAGGVEGIDGNRRGARDPDITSKRKASALAAEAKPRFNLPSDPSPRRKGGGAANFHLLNDVGE